VRAKHQANLMYVLDDLTGWRQAMVAELGAAKFRGAWIRIHDFLGQFRCVSRERVSAA
jgi:protein gp88